MISKQMQNQADLHQKLQIVHTEPNSTANSTKTSLHEQVPQTMEDVVDVESTYDFRILYFAFFAIYLGRTLILPLLPSYGDEVWKEQWNTNSTLSAKQNVDKLPDGLQGVLAGLFYISYAIAGIAFGPLSIRIGRKPVLLLCIIGMTFGFIGQAMAPNYWTLVSARTFAGFFAAINGLCQSYISDICKPSLVPKYTARLGTVFGLVFGFGPLFAVILCAANQWILEHLFNDIIPSHRYRLSLAIGACITGISSILVAFRLKESLPDSLRVKWNSNKTGKSLKSDRDQIQNILAVDLQHHLQTEGSQEMTTKIPETAGTHSTISRVEVLSVLRNPDYDDVSKFIINILKTQQSECDIMKQIRFNMKHHEDTINVAEEVLASSSMDDSYFEDLVDAINESRALMVVPEDRAMTPEIPPEIHYVDQQDKNQLIQVIQQQNEQNPIQNPIPNPEPQIFQESPPNVFDTGHSGDITPDRRSAGRSAGGSVGGTEGDFERDLVCIEYNETRHEHRETKEGEIEFAALFEAMLPERERTPEFKRRLFRYMVGVLFITVIMDIATAGHATVFALLNKRQSTPKTEGLEWSDTMFGISWMLYGVSYSLVQLFYVRLQIKYGAFRTGALGCFIKMIGCIMIPLLTMLCRNTVHNWGHRDNVQWLEILIHSPASILNGIGYGLSNTATQIIISDYAKRYDVRSVGNWLGTWMGCIALGAAGVIMLGQVASAYSASGAFYVCAECAFVSMVIYLVLAHLARDIPIAVDMKQVIMDNVAMTEHLDQCTIDEHAEKSVSRITGRLSTISQLTELLSGRASSLSPPLTPNLQIIAAVNAANVLTPGSRMLKGRNSSVCTSDSKFTTTASFRRNVTESINQSSALISLSSFNVSAPFGPFPMVTPSALLGIPMGGSSGYTHHTPRRMGHVDLKNLTAGNVHGNTHEDRASLNNLVLSPNTIIRIQGPTEQRQEPVLRTIDLGKEISVEEQNQEK